MILKNYLLFILKKQMLTKFNFLNIFLILYIKNFFINFPYYIFKFKLNLNIVNFYKVLLNLFKQRIYLLNISLKSIFKIKFILLNFILNIKKYDMFKYLDYFLIYLNLNYSYFIKKKINIIIFNNKLLLNNNNIQNFYKKFYKYDCFILYKFFINLNNNCNNKYNSYFYKNFLIY